MLFIPVSDILKQKCMMFRILVNLLTEYNPRNNVERIWVRYGELVCLPEFQEFRLNSGQNLCKKIETILRTIEIININGRIWTESWEVS